MFLAQDGNGSTHGCPYSAPSTGNPCIQTGPRLTWTPQPRRPVPFASTTPAYFLAGPCSNFLIVELSHSSRTASALSRSPASSSERIVSPRSFKGTKWQGYSSFIRSGGTKSAKRQSSQGSLFRTSPA